VLLLIFREAVQRMMVIVTHKTVPILLVFPHPRKVQTTQQQTYVLTTIVSGVIELYDDTAWEIHRPKVSGTIVG
jgi:hypothetical protein